MAGDRGDRTSGTRSTRTTIEAPQGAGDDQVLSQVSGGGSTVTFQVQGDHGGATYPPWHIARWSLADGTVTIIDANGDDGSTDPSISGDGKLIAFSSLATNLVAGDTNGLPDVFIWQQS